MKLKNKKTGKIHEITEVMSLSKLEKQIVLYSETDKCNYKYSSLAELNEEWEDYEELKKYWYIDCYGIVLRTLYNGNEWDERRKEIGNYFETKEEAEKAVEKLKAWKRLKDKGFRFTGWYSSGDTTNTIRIYAEFPDVELGPIAGRDLDLLFGGEE